MRNYHILQDTILYTVVAAPGGVDGCDCTDKGGSVLLATFDKQHAEKNAQDSRFTIKKDIVNQSDIDAALAKLTPVERFLIEIHNTNSPKYRTPLTPVPGFDDGRP